MKKVLAVASATLMLSSIAGVSAAHHNDDHDANNHGMCTAYFSGSENGQQNKRDNGNAFFLFEETVGDYDGDGDDREDGRGDAYDIAAFCNDMTGGFGNPGGGNTAFFSDDDTQNPDGCTNPEGDECSYQGGDGTGSNDGKGNGNNG